MRPIEHGSKSEISTALSARFSLDRGLVLRNGQNGNPPVESQRRVRTRLDSVRPGQCLSLRNYARRFQIEFPTKMWLIGRGRRVLPCWTLPLSVKFQPEISAVIKCAARHVRCKWGDPRGTAIAGTWAGQRVPRLGGLDSRSGSRARASMRCAHVSPYVRTAAPTQGTDAQWDTTGRREILVGGFAGPCFTSN
jgi:hypothetical protein